MLSLPKFLSSLLAGSRFGTMRLLFVAFIFSMCALLWVAIVAARHVRRHNAARAGAQEGDSHVETFEARIEAPIDRKIDRGTIAAAPTGSPNAPGS